MIYDRRPKRSFTLPAIPVTAYAAAAAILIVATGLWFFSRPSDSARRVEALERQAAAIKVAAASRGDLTAYPAGSVCTARVDDSFRNQLTSALANSGLKVEALDIRQEGKVEGKRPLMAYTVSLKANGSYEQALTGLDVMAAYRPRVFLESLSLRNQTDSVALNLEGRLYCRWTQQS